MSGVESMHVCGRLGGGVFVWGSRIVRRDVCVHGGGL